MALPQNPQLPATIRKPGVLAAALPGCAYPEVLRLSLMIAQA